MRGRPRVSSSRRADTPATPILNYELSITNCEYNTINSSSNPLIFKLIHFQIVSFPNHPPVRGGLLRMEVESPQGRSPQGTG